MAKEDVVYVFHRLLRSHKKNGRHLCSPLYNQCKKNEILPFAAMWMDLENIMLSEISQTEKDQYYMVSFICGI